MPSGKTGHSSYALDSDHVITWVDEGFRRFAEANGVPELADTVIGRPLWDYVDGLETQELLRILFNRASMYGPMSFPYRCDGPAVRRSMVLEVTPTADGGLELSSRLRSAESRPPVRLNGNGHRTTELLRLCSWCNRLEAEGVWVEPELGVTLVRPFEQPTPSITHGICPACLQALIPDHSADPAT